LDLSPIADHATGLINSRELLLIDATLNLTEIDNGKERDAIVLNPPADYELEESDKLILIFSTGDQNRVSPGTSKTALGPVEPMNSDHRYGAILKLISGACGHACSHHA
jgi:hypothetical protein